MFFLNDDHLRSNLSHVHQTHLTHAHTYVNDHNRCQKQGVLQRLGKTPS